MGGRQFSLQVDGKVRVIPLVGIERGNSGSRTWSVVVSKLREREQREPVVLLIVAVDLDVLFQGLVSVLGLTITFRMVPRGKVQLHVQGRAKRSEEVQDELRTPITSYMGRDPVLREDVDDEE